MQSDAAQLLRDHGLQVTAQRLAVLRSVLRRPHRRADQIAEDARAEIGTISKQAVYDALSTLSDKRLIRRVQAGGSPAIYDPRVDDHHHVICRSCGATADIDSSGAEASYVRAAESSGFQVDGAELIFWGTCPRCLQDPGAEATTP